MTINVKSLEEICFLFLVDSIEIFVFDRSLISKPPSKRKNTRKHKVHKILRENFFCPDGLITEDETSRLRIKVFDKSIPSEDSNNVDDSSYEIKLKLSKSNPFPSLPIVSTEKEKGSIDFILQSLNEKLRAKASETIVGEEKYFYAFRVNVVFSMAEYVYADEFVRAEVNTFFKSLKTSSLELPFNLDQTR